MMNNIEEIASKSVLLSNFKNSTRNDVSQHGGMPTVSDLYTGKKQFAIVDYTIKYRNCFNYKYTLI